MAPAALVFAVALAYFNALDGAFQFDDYNVIVHNPAVHSLSAWLDSMPGIRPLLKLTYTLNWVIDPQPPGFHLFNIAVHCANAVLVYWLLRRVLNLGHEADWAPFVGALLFALHPVQTEAVTYVCGRSVSLMALFYLASLMAWMHADRTLRAQRWRLLSAALFGAALLVKETAVTLPLALLLLDAIGREQPYSVRQLLRRQIWHWSLLAAGLLVMAASPSYRHLLEASVATRGLTDNLLTQIHAVFYLAGQLLLPWRMNADPDLPVLSAMTPMLALQILFLLAIVFIGLRNLRRRAWLAFAVLWFAIHLLPTNSLLPRLDVANDRQLYLACIGVFFAVGVGIQHLLQRASRRLLTSTATGLLCVMLGVATAQRNQVYASQITFWQDAAMKSPRKPRVYNNLGYAYQLAGHFTAAREAYSRAIELDPQYWQARINLDALEAAQRNRQHEN